MKAAILLLGFYCMTLPVWSQATITSMEEETWFSSRPARAVQRDRGVIRNPKMLLEFLQREYPEVKIRRWVRPATSRGRSYRKDIAAYQNHRRACSTDRECSICLEVFHIRHSEVEDVLAFLSALVPDVALKADGTNLAVTGSTGCLAQIRELIQEIDRPLDLIMLDHRLIDLSEEMQGCVRIVWSEPALTESRVEYVLGVPLSKTPTNNLSATRLGSFAVSRRISPKKPSSVVPLVETSR